MRIAALTLLLGALTQIRPPAADVPPFRFDTITSKAGVAFSLVSGDAKKMFIPETNSGGVGLFDYDNDGWLDIYLVNGSTLDAERRGGSRGGNRLYRNNRNGTFSDVTVAAGVGGHHWGNGVCVGDVNGDGFDDVYVTNLGPNILYMNSGTGTFRDASKESNTADPRWSSSCAFADADGDGDLDLYVSNYLQFDIQNPPTTINGEPCTYRGLTVNCGPAGLPPTPDRFYENAGGGRFIDATRKAGFDRVKPSFGMGVVWFDLERDGDMDLYVANDTMPNFLFRNDGKGRFTDIALLAGAALSFDGRSQAGMGVDAADYDDDGDFDLVVTNFSDDYNSLYVNAGGVFTDGSTPSGLVRQSIPYVGWGVQFGDFNLDGRQELVVANGHVFPVLDEVPRRRSQTIGYKQRNQLFFNAGDNRFVDAAPQLRELPGFEEELSSRGLAVGDLNNDGRLDLVIANLDQPPSILLNQTPSAGSWLLLKLVGKPPNTTALGAIASVRVGSRTLTRLVKSGASYQSQSDLRLHFGLGGASSVDEVTVTWPGGSATTLKQVKPNQILVVRQP